MKKILAFLLILVLVLSPVIAYSDLEVATPTDLEPVEPPVDPPSPPDNPPDEPPSDTGPPTVDFTVTLNNLNQFGIVALNDCQLKSHMRNSVWVGGTLTGESYEINVDDGTSWSTTTVHNSYIHNKQGNFIFKSRNNARGADAYCILTDSAVSSTINYWYGVYNQLGSNGETCIYVPASSDGVAYIHGGENGFPRYQCQGDDESAYDGPSITYWTDAPKVEVRDICGFVIAPASNILLLGNNRVSVVGNNVEAKWGETHINSKTPTIVGPTPSPTPTATPTPTPTATPKPITVTKQLQGEIWQVRCDVMDNTSFQAGGGYWMADITNHSNVTSKEGHRSNHCGNKENWVMFVNTEGKAISLYQLKSGSTGGTLPSIVYRAPADLAAIPESQLIYDPTDPNDPMTARLINEVFIPENAMPFEEINLQEGQRLFWISQNGSQVWHHTGVLHRTNPKFAIVINGTVYNLGVGDSITLTDIEEGLLEIEEIATANYKLKTIEYDEEGNAVIINEIDPPNKPTPTPPPAIVTATPTPTPTPTAPPGESTNPPVITESPSPTPTITPTPTPSPTPTNPSCSLIVQKKIVDTEDIEEAIFFFKISSAELEEPMYIEILVNEHGIGEYVLVDMVPGKYTVEEVDIPEGYVLVSEGSVTQYITEDVNVVFEFENKKEEVSPSPSPSPTTSPTPTVTPTPTPTPTLTPTPTPTSTPTPTLPPHVVDVKVDENHVTWYKLDNVPVVHVPEDQPQPQQHSEWLRWDMEIDEYDTALAGQVLINHVGDCFD